VEDVPSKMLTEEGFIPYQVIAVDISFSEIFEVQRDILFGHSNNFDSSLIVQRVRLLILIRTPDPKALGPEPQT
jgi:hypothetical protein